MPSLTASQEAHVQRIEHHFQTFNVYDASFRARAAGGGFEGAAFTFGYSDPRVLLPRLTAAGLQQHDRFIDLGSGMGHAALTAALVCDDVTGVECVPGNHNNAVAAASVLGSDAVTFRCGDMLAESFSAYSFLYTYATCFSAGLFESLITASEVCEPGAKFMVVGRAVENPHWVLQSEESCVWSTLVMPGATANKTLSTVVRVYLKR